MAKKSKGLGASYGKAAANKRRFSRVSSGSAIKKRVPKACALVKVAGGRVKTRKGCVIRKNGAWCDELLLDRLPAQAKDRKRGVMVDCK